MADEDIVGIIQVPLNAYTYQPGKGREKDPTIVKHLADIFNKEGCNPDQWEHHIKGEVDAATYSRLLVALGLSEDKLRNTVQTGKYPRVRIRRRIVCLDGRQRIAAARGKFGTDFWWPVKLFRDSRASRFSHQTKYPDGEICWHMFRLALGKPDLGGDWTSELTKSKRKILNLLLRREDGVLKYEEFVDALCDVLEFPGTRRGFKLGNMHKYTASRCLEFPVRYLRRMSHIYRRVAGDASVVPHMDSETIECFQYRHTSNSSDEDYIRLMMDTRGAFRGVKSASVRRAIKQELLSLDAIFPSFETFHQNMIYFSVGAKILRTHIIDDPDKSQEGNKKQGDVGVFESLQACWTEPKRPLIEVSDGIFRPLVLLDVELACMLLFLDGLRDCLHLSKEPILQDRRGEPTPVAAVDPWYVSRLRARARRYGFRTTKISRGLAAEPPPPRQLGWDLDWDARAKNWRGGKPTIRNFLDLQRDAFLPILEQADSRMTVTAAVVQKDFLEAFFGSWSYMIDGPEIASDSGLPGDVMEIDDDGLRLPHESATPVRRDQPSSQPQIRSAQQTKHGLDQHQTQEVFQGLAPKQAPPHQVPETVDQVDSPGEQGRVLAPAMQVDQPEPTLAEIFENQASTGINIRSSRRKPLRRHDTNQRSISPTSRIPASRYRRNRSPVGLSRSPIRPPTRATAPAGSERAIEELVRQRLIQPPQNSAQPSPPLEAESHTPPVYEGPASQLQEPVVHTTEQQTTPTRDKVNIRKAARQQATRLFRLDPTGRPDRTDGKPSRRSPVQPPKPATPVGPPEAASAGISRARLADAFEVPAPTEDLPRSQAGSLHAVRRQPSTKSSRYDPWNRAGRATTGSSRRSPIQPPKGTSPAATPVTKPTHDKLTRRSPIHPPAQPKVHRVPEIPEVSPNLTADRPGRQVQEPQKGSVSQPSDHLIQNENIDVQLGTGSSKRPPILPPKTLHPSKKSAKDNTSIEERSVGVDAAGHPSRRSPVDPPDIQTPRRSERIRLLSQEPSNPPPQASSTSLPPPAVAEKKDARRKISRTRPPKLQTSQHTDARGNGTPRRSERIRLLSQEPSGPDLPAPSTSRPSEKVTDNKDARRKIIQKRLQKIQNRQEADVLQTPARPKKKLEKARRQSRKRKVVPRHPQASHELDTPRDNHITSESPGHPGGNNQVVGVVRASDEPAIAQAPPPRGAHPPAPPREMGRNRKRKREAEQIPTEPGNDQQEISRKRVSARPTYELSSSPLNPRVQRRRSPIRPPRSGFRVPSVSSQESLQATRTFRVPSASSAESLRGPGRSPIRPPATGFRVPSMSSQESLQATKTFFVPTASSQENLQGQGRSPIRPIKTISTGPSKSPKKTFRRDRPSPIRRPTPPLLSSAGGPGPGTGNVQKAQSPEDFQNTDLEGLREFQPFSESKAQYPLPDDLPDDFPDEEEW